MKPTKKDTSVKSEAPKKAEEKKVAPVSKAPAPKAPAKAAAPSVSAKATEDRSDKKAAAPKPVRPKTPGKKPLSHGVGRRKRSVARVWLRRGKGTVTVNGKASDVHFDTDFNRAQVALPLSLLPTGVTYDVDVNVRGGGTTTQAAAVKLGIARALLASDESMRPRLRKHRLLSVDSRVKERKKYGQRGARRKFQFVKR